MQAALMTADQRIVPGREPWLADGVRGYVVRYGGWLWLPVIVAEREGSGDVGRFLDHVEPAEIVAVPTVINARLRGMLERRGWHAACDIDTGALIMVRMPVEQL